jgi:uncharacterized membrane protein YuzA (DUF378 family)
MNDTPRYRLANGVGPALTRIQWWIVGISTLVGVFGLILDLTGKLLVAAPLLGLSGMTYVLTALIANHQSRSK